MAMLNGIAREFLQRPLLMLFFQVSFASIVAAVALRTELTFDMTKKLCVVPLSFLLVMFCEYHLVQHSNMETVLVLRSTVPVVLSIVLLNKKSRPYVCICTIGIVASFRMHMAIETAPVLWVVAWFASFMFHQVHTKHVVDTAVGMTTWSMVWFINTTQVFILTPLPIVFEEKIVINGTTVISLMISTCVVHLATSYSSFRFRREVNDTVTFVVVGNTCQLFSSMYLNHDTSMSAFTSLVTCTALTCVVFIMDRRQEAKQDKIVHVV